LFSHLALIPKILTKNFGGSTVILKTLLRLTLSYTWLSALPIMPQLILHTIPVWLQTRLR